MQVSGSRLEQDIGTGIGKIGVVGATFSLIKLVGIKKVQLFGASGCPG